ncbi:MAG TPA: 2-oxoacid:ferredoxin oxidoreductase subunit gamma [Erysipelotrichaceae bacterium]|nr:2-oxoacid:acceptor oxidoreductase family protein [Solobacterium sp.]HAE15204.1 2-oxoacid:ferredoxin oxidoreductase subunit gamma [Erysipelotrichaceae bacterium]
MADFEIVIAGFGGQGLLFTGKVLAYAGLLEGRELSWLPSYGPEMRGGTANCNVILSDTPVGSPIVQHPNVLMVMNAPSLDKYEADVAPGGTIFVDSSLIERKVNRDDVTVYYIPATRMAAEAGLSGLANMILLGAMIRTTGCISEDTLPDALHKVIPERKAHLFDANMKAIEAGRAEVA